jgi:uncharacterized membrane-anchored protein YhcB (DUF1043 family)
MEDGMLMGWRTALLLILAGIVVGTLLVPVFEWAGM